MKAKNHPYEVGVATRPESGYAESFRKLPLDIRLSSVDKEPKVIQIVSSLAGEHKTSTAVNLAAVYVELGYKVLVIDCDLRRPKVHRVCELINDNGLTSYLVNKCDYQSLIKHTQYHFDVINAGEKVPYPHVILRSEKFRQLMEQLRQDYDYIIVDTPPVLMVTDSLIISDCTDTCLFVINQKTSTKSETKEAIRLLKDAKVAIAGAVFSNVSKRITRYYNSYDKY